MMKLSVVVPIFNEIRTLPVIFSALAKLKLSCEFEVIYVDDGSVDGSVDWLKGQQKRYLKDKKFKFLYHDKNLGKGAAIQSAIRIASGEYLIIQDADLEYNPKEIQNLIDCQTKNGALVVFGSRNTSEKPNKYLYPHYYLGSWFLSLLLSIFFGCRLSDPETCYKLINLDLFKFISINEKGFGVEMEIVAKILRLKIKIYETPISYKPRSFEQGKKIRAKDGIYAVKLLLKIFFKDLQYGLVDRFLRWRREVNARKYLNLGLNQVVVDVGCGRQAHLGWMLREKIKTYIGVDHDLPDLEVDNMNFMSLDVHDLKKTLINIRVDSIVGLAIIEHLNNPGKFISECGQLLKKDGEIILTTPHPSGDKILKILGWLGLIDPDEIKDHKRYFTSDELAQFLEKMGFEVITKQRFLLGLNSCVVARKGN